MENRQYKKALKEGNIPGLFGAFLQERGVYGKNPLEKVDEEGSYEIMNRDSGEFSQILVIHIAWANLIL